MIAYIEFNERRNRYRWVLVCWDHDIAYGRWLLSKASVHVAYLHFTALMESKLPELDEYI